MHLPKSSFETVEIYLRGRLAEKKGLKQVRFAEQTLNS